MPNVIRAAASISFHAERETVREGDRKRESERHDEATVALCNFTNMPKNRSSR